MSVDWDGNKRVSVGRPPQQLPEWLTGRVDVVGQAVSEEATQQCNARRRLLGRADCGCDEEAETR